MICPHIVNLSLLIGAVLSYGIMWPLISGLKGEWYPANVSTSSMKSLNGYKVRIRSPFLEFCSSPIRREWPEIDRFLWCVCRYLFQ